MGTPGKTCILIVEREGDLRLLLRALVLSVDQDAEIEFAPVFPKSARLRRKIDLIILGPEAGVRYNEHKSGGAPRILHVDDDDENSSSSRNFTYLNSSLGIEHYRRQITEALKMTRR
jgi:hypothetical protein